MNYYIQGDAANADQIKAAFEKLGYNTGNLGFTSGQLYYTVEEQEASSFIEDFRKAMQ